MKESTLFKILCIGTIVSFLLCGYSLIMCFALVPDESEIGSHYLEISYLFMHLIICAIIFYLAFRAMRFGSFFIKNNMYDYDGNVYKKKFIVFIVLDVICFLVFIYSFVQGITMALPLATQLGEVIWHDLMNAFFLLGVILLTFVLYPKVPYKHSNKHAE